MGAGKSSVGRELARTLGRPFLDSDAEIERSGRETAAEIAAGRGVQALHAIELGVLVDMVTSETPAVIAAAASVSDSEEGRELMGRCRSVALTASPGVLAERLGAGEHRRPVSMAELEALSRRRAVRLRDVALVTVDTSHVSVHEVVRQIVDSLDTD
jgi:shikimate kinase